MKALTKTATTWPFAYYSGCGNLFLIAFDPQDIHKGLHPEQLQVIAKTKNVDGLLFLGKRENLFQMKYFNRDGSEADMCGNGLRCLGHCIFSSIDTSQTTCTIHTKNGPRTLSLISDHLVKTDMGDIPPTQELAIDKEKIFSTNTGVPHAIFVRDRLPEGPIEEKGRYIRFHPLFHPKGTNFSYAVFEKDIVSIRTYERGVERETDACGTGACATAVILHAHYNRSFPMTIRFASNEKALIEKENDRLFLTAPCHMLGIYEIQNPLLS